MKRKALRLLTALLNVDGVEIPANDINVDFYTGNVRIDDKELHLVAEKVTEYRPVRVLIEIMCSTSKARHRALWWTI